MSAENSIQPGTSERREERSAIEDLRVSLYFFLLLAERQAGRVLLNQNARNALGGVIARPAHDQINVALAAAADERFRSVENVMISFSFGARFQRGGVTSRTLMEIICRDLLPRRSDLTALNNDDDVMFR